MLAGLPTVVEDIQIGSARLFEGVSEDSETRRVERA
jgi:hypothetical protein